VSERETKQEGGLEEGRRKGGKELMGEVDRLTLHNPWGSTQDWKLDDVFGDIVEVDHLTNWEQWVN
jgi:hypothetical protein